MIHIAILRVVRPGREKEFEDKIAGFFAKAENQPGTAGAFLIRRIEAASPREYGILRSFESPQAKERFYASPLYREWSDAVKPLVEGEPVKRELHGLEAFFRHGPSEAPPTWKMAILTWVAVNPAVYAFATLVPAAFGKLPMPLELLVVNVFVVASLTWVLMPLLTRAFARWLQPRPRP